MDTNQSTDYNPSERKWSISRIISLAVLLILVLVVIGWGVTQLFSGSTPTASKHSVATSSGNHSSTSQSKSKTSASSSQSKSNQTSASANGSSAAPSTSGAQSAQSGSAAETNPTTSSNLANTGPGDTALIGFISASLIGAVLHYSWRRRFISGS